MIDCAAVLDSCKSPFNKRTSPVSAINVAPTVAVPLIAIELTPVTTPPATDILSIDTAVFVLLLLLLLLILFCCRLIVLSLLSLFVLLLLVVVGVRCIILVAARGTFARL